MTTQKCQLNSSVSRQVLNQLYHLRKISSQFADKIIITDDNPRCEDAAQIRKEILSACDQEKTIEIAGRKIAIEYAVKNLEQDDILLIAGKGHEKYQIIADQKFEFDEEQIVMDAIHLI